MTSTTAETTESTDAVLDSRIVGNELAQSGLLRAWRSGRLAHAHLFVGPNGIGKRRIALALAKAIVCASPTPIGAPCHSCRACKNVDADAHTDVRVFSRDKSTFSTELMREVILDWASRKPREGRHKIGILDEVEHLGIQAANAFLKTLEEPPAGTMWILVTSDPGATLTTIRSRCQATAFHPLDGDQIEGLLNGALRADMMAAATEAASRVSSKIKAKPTASGRSKAKAPKFDDFSHEPEDDFDEDGGSSGPSIEPNQRSFAIAFGHGSPGAAIASIRDGLMEVRNLLLARLAAAARRTSNLPPAHASASPSSRPGASIAEVQHRASGIASPTGEGPLEAADDLRGLLERKDEPTQEGMRTRLLIAVGLAESLVRDLLAISAGASTKLFNSDKGGVLRSIMAERPVAVGNLQSAMERFAVIRRAINGNASVKLASANLIFEIDGLWD